MVKLEKCVCVFDLDDTLYKERDYQSSGYDHIKTQLQALYGADVSSVLLEAQDRGGDVLQSICKTLQLPQQSKESLLWMYRLHYPQIKLDAVTTEALHQMDSEALAVVILTDGRAITQRLKVHALGLDMYPLYISEDWAEVKPGEKRFLAIMEAYKKAEQFVYIGDNLSKDFVTPNKLGWLTIGLKDKNKLNIHSQDTSVVGDEYLPDYWVDNLSELKDYLC